MKFLQAADTILQAAEIEKPKFTIIAGDLFNGSILMEDPSVADMGLFLRRLSRICPVVGVYGTPSHDVPGILDTYTIMYDKEKFPVFIAAEPTILAVMNDGNVTRLDLAKKENIETTIALLPTPTGRAQAADTFEDIKSRWLSEAAYMYTTMQAEAPDKCKILVGHMSTDFCGIRTGLIIPAAEIPKFDFIGLGHEHAAPFSTDHPKISYCGSIFHTEANDTSIKYAKFIDLGDRPGLNEEVKVYPLPSKPFIRINLPFLGVPEDLTPWTDVKDFDVTIGLEVPSGTEPKDIDAVLVRLRAFFTNLTVKIRIIPIVKAKIPEIGNSPDFETKFKLWAAISKVEITDTLLEKIKSLEAVE